MYKTCTSDLNICLTYLLLAMKKVWSLDEKGLTVVYPWNRQKAFSIEIFYSN